MYILLGACLALLPPPSPAGADSLGPVTVAVFVLDESVDLPTHHSLTYRFDPAVSLEADVPIASRSRGEWLLSGGIGYYRHSQLRSALFADARFGYRRTFGRGSAQLDLGPGYGHVFTRERAYRYEGGDYVEVVDRGSAVFCPAAALTLGYRVTAAPRPWRALARARFTLESPFAVLPLPHVFLGLGVSHTLPSR